MGGFSVGLGRQESQGQGGCDKHGKVEPFYRAVGARLALRSFQKWRPRGQVSVPGISHCHSCPW